jgi:hypothetical protein
VGNLVASSVEVYLKEKGEKSYEEMVSTIGCACHYHQEKIACIGLLRQHDPFAGRSYKEYA